MYRRKFLAVPNAKAAASVSRRVRHLPEASGIRLRPENQHAGVDNRQADRRDLEDDELQLLHAPMSLRRYARPS